MKTDPKLTVLAFSAGKQSSALLWMVLRGEIPRPLHFIVLNADPGMEDKRSYPYVDMMEQKCKEASIPFIKVKRNLYQELMDLKKSGKKRFDTPPFWTKNRETGKIGRLIQTCTLAYKIVPMDQAMRKYMEEHLGIPRNRKRLGNNVVCKWIGFSFDEQDRIKQQKRKYIYHEYPLIDLGYDKKDVDLYFVDRLLPVPPRSVCNACFANDLAYLKEMYEQRQDDWAKAVEIDDEVRDLTCIGIRDECYVFSGCIPLRNLAGQHFQLGVGVKEQADQRCSSGHCFL